MTVKATSVSQILPRVSRLHANLGCGSVASSGMEMTPSQTNGEGDGREAEVRAGEGALIKTFGRSGGELHFLYPVGEGLRLTFCS